ncbi:MAG: 5-(carboxyamino)imidazole ribonucleotide mutase [Solobacterium sp.]|nr:5-(carboxyamino)imidazole ribonucleotide mutase [Solobacterium sp.]
MKKTAIIMGSDTDWTVMKKAALVLKELELPFEVHVYSAHRTPLEVSEFAKNARANGFGVIIAGAGMSAALAGCIAAETTLPVIGVPISATLDGMDALLSTTMMPPGIPVASVGVDGARNAGLLAAEVLAVTDEALASRLAEKKRDMHDAVIEKDARMQETVKEL